MNIADNGDKEKNTRNKINLCRENDSVIKIQHLALQKITKSMQIVTEDFHNQTFRIEEKQTLQERV